jgi:membrane associated rhomboid family serine protease
MYTFVPKDLRRQTGRALSRQVIVLGTIVAVMWLLEMVDVFLGGALNSWGIRPRTLEGLGRILTAPWVHAGFGHLIANTIPLVVLGFLVLLRGLRDFVVAAGVAALVSGLGIWLFGGPQTLHLGASGVIFGLFGYLLARAYFERSWLALIFAGVAVLLYGGMLWGVLPVRQGVSWLGHLFGLFGGVLAAWLVVDRR